VDRYHDFAGRRDLSLPLNVCRSCRPRLVSYDGRMNVAVARIAEEALLLPPSERAEVVERILASLERTDPELDRAWTEEATDRFEAFQRGELGARGFGEIIAEHRQSSG